MWMLSDPNQEPIIHEIERLEDRGAALVAAAFVESRLMEVIKTAMRSENKLQNALFRGTGPLAAFSTKIDLGYLLSLYPDEIHKQLHYVRTIRNEFAHNEYPTTFSSQRVKDLCGNMIPVDPRRFSDLPVGFGVGMPEEHRDIVKKLVMGAVNVEDTPRNRFIATVKICVAVLAFLRMAALLPDE